MSLVNQVRLRFDDDGAAVARFNTKPMAELSRILSQRLSTIIVVRGLVQSGKTFVTDRAVQVSFCASKSPVRVRVSADPETGDFLPEMMRRLQSIVSSCTSAKDAQDAKIDAALDSLVSSPEAVAAFVRQKRVAHFAELQRQLLKGAIPMVPGFAPTLHHEPEATGVVSPRPLQTPPYPQVHPQPGASTRGLGFMELVSRWAAADRSGESVLTLEIANYDVVLQKQRPKTESQLYALIEAAAEPLFDRRVIVILETLTSKATHSLKLQSRLSEAAVVFVSGPQTAADVLLLYSSWFSDCAQLVSLLNSDARFRDALAEQVELYSTISHYQVHAEVFAAMMDSMGWNAEDEASSLEPSTVDLIVNKFVSGFDNHVTNKGWLRALPSEMGGLQFLLTAAAHPLEEQCHLRHLETYCFDDIYASFTEMFQMAYSGKKEHDCAIIRRYHASKEAVEREFRQLLDIGVFGFCDTRNAVSAGPVQRPLGIHSRSVRCMLSLHDLESVLRARRSEFGFMSSHRFCAF